MADKKTAPGGALSSEVQANGNALQPQYSPAAPQALHPPTQSSYDNIPAELRALRQWVAADADKRPINPHTGQPASVTDPSTWGTLAEAVARGPRIGFVFTADDPYCGIDLDQKTGDEAEASLHTRILEAFPSYTEQSASGKGYHIIVKAMLSHGRRRDSVEVYSYARYFIFTGNVVRQVPIIEAQGKVDALVKEMPAAQLGIDLVDTASPYTDEQVQATARGARNGAKYEQLCAGDWKAMGYPSQSEADHALLSIIAFYTPNNEQVRRLFRCTGLGKRDKAIKNDKYLNTSLKKVRAEQAEKANTAQQESDVAKWLAKVEFCAPSALPAPVDAADDDLPPIPGPKVVDAMYYGITGDVMRAACSGTEVHPAAVGSAFLSFASAALGRNRWVPIGDKNHHARLYTAHVGRSGIGGKGMALDLARRIREKVENGRDPVQDGQFACGNFHDGGLSSREGMGYMIRDPSEEKDKEGKTLDAGVDDKRLFVVEEEFANVLRQTKREGNTLSAAIRTAWDGGAIAPATKSNRIRVDKPHIAIHANITPNELRVSLDNNDLTNGFANRFLFVWAERCGIVPYPSRTPDDVVEQFAQKLLAAIRRARNPGEVRAADDARRRFSVFYHEHKRGLGTTAQLRGLLERHPPYAWRLALTFALLDCRDEIDDDHMAAALAWLNYYRESTRFIFSTTREEAVATKVAGLGERIVDQLKQAGDQAMDREPLRIALGKPSAKDFDAALQQLQDASQLDEIVTPRKNGWPLRQYRLKAMAPPPPVVGREGTA